MSEHTENDSQKQHWLDDSANIDKLYKGLIVICVLLMLVDVLDVAHLFYHKHIHFRPEGWFGFYGFFGFLAYALIVVGGFIWRGIVGRGEDYYDQ